MPRASSMRGTLRAVEVVFCTCALLVAAACEKVDPEPKLEASAFETVPRPPTVKAEHIDAAEKTIASLTAIGIILDQTPDCVAAAKEMESAVARFATSADALERTIRETNADPAARAWFEENYMKRMQLASKPMMLRARSCKDDPTFQATMEKLPTLRKKGRR
jgi:hypothetical protein